MWQGGAGRYAPSAVEQRHRRVGQRIEAHCDEQRVIVQLAVLLERPRADRVRRRQLHVRALWHHQRVASVLLLLERWVTAYQLDALRQLGAMILSEVNGQPRQRLPLIVLAIASLVFLLALSLAST